MQNISEVEISALQFPNANQHFHMETDDREVTGNVRACASPNDHFGKVRKECVLNLLLAAKLANQV